MIAFILAIALVVGGDEPHRHLAVRPEMKPCVARVLFLKDGRTFRTPARLDWPMRIDWPCVLGQPVPARPKAVDELEAAMVADKWNDIDRDSREKTGKGIDEFIGSAMMGF